MLQLTKDESRSPEEQLLEQAYLNARYTVNGISLKIGEPHPEFDRWLSERSAFRYAILTAHNPQSRPLAPTVNQARNDTLQVLLDQLQLEYVPASGEDPAGVWPSETGFCILDGRPTAPREIGRLYEQYAIVVGERGGSPGLRWL
ncbi:hypothetical protein GGR28_001169 [Lewinella aquimaris]|uniref:DUF3293 domain-containing protein n=1 Tax=Neolewinella aquimaris TaxID=1835722 RepID=A0A840EC54_9BACT|nr:DUF3293 domain-containing protein [Neolewinella aquimaris]MBB4078556.1 hypothetical protein [Neolewinella aquimaris]